VLYRFLDRTILNVIEILQFSPGTKLQVTVVTVSPFLLHKDVRSVRTFRLFYEGSDIGWSHCSFAVWVELLIVSQLIRYSAVISSWLIWHVDLLAHKRLRLHRLYWQSYMIVTMFGILTFQVHHFNALVL
jgi:hypothetical protein